MSESADALDAAVCILAGADFVRGSVQAPEDTALAMREGGYGFPQVLEMANNMQFDAALAAQ